MKSLNRFIISFFAIALTFVSCNNNLKETIFSNVTEDSYKYNNVYQAMGIAYVPLRLLFSSYQGFYMAQETTSDELVMPQNPQGGWNDGGIYHQMHLHSWTSETPQLLNMWNAFYKGVIESNMVLGLLERNRVPIPTGFTKESFISEIKVLRAFYYWLIIDNFGAAPLDTLTSLANNTLPSLTPRKDLYNFVVNQITEALPNLTTDNSSHMFGRFNRWAADALLANLYLNAQVYTGQAEWDKCVDVCNDIIAGNKYILDPSYQNIFSTNNQSSPEIIFAIPYDQTLGQGFDIEMYAWESTLKAKANLVVTPYGTGSVRGIPQFIETYNPDDKRLKETWLIGPQYALNGAPIPGVFTNGKQLDYIDSMPNGLQAAEYEGYRMNKFQIAIGAQRYLNNSFPIFRYTGVLMMKAECLLRTGDADDAAQLVTQVRSRDFTNPQEAVVTGSQLLGNSIYHYGYVENYKIVDPGDQGPVKYGSMLDELGWEFVWEAHRRRDDIRFGVFTSKSWLSHKPEADENDRTVFMIPQAAVDANPKLK